MRVSFDPCPPVLSHALVLMNNDSVTYSDSAGTSSSATTGTVTTSGSSDAFTVGGSRSRGTAHTTSTATTKGMATSTGSAFTTSSAHGGSVTDQTGSAESRGRGEAYASIYRDLPSDSWTLEELIHTKSVALAHVPQGQAWIRSGSSRPRRIRVPYVGGQIALPERVARVRRELLERTPFAAPAAQVDAEYQAYRAQLLAPPSHDDLDLQITQPAAAGEEPETVPIAKLLEWK